MYVTNYFVTTVTQLPAPTSANTTKISTIQHTSILARRWFPPPLAQFTPVLDCPYLDFYPSAGMTRSAAALNVEQQHWIIPLAGYSVLGPVFDTHPVADCIHGAVKVVRWMKYKSLWESGSITNKKITQMNKGILTIFILTIFVSVFLLWQRSVLRRVALLPGCYRRWRRGDTSATAWWWWC